MAKSPFKWKVCPKPSCIWTQREWPECYTNDDTDNIVAYIRAKGGYPYRKSHDGTFDLHLFVKVPGQLNPDTFRWQKLKREASNIAEAKQILLAFYEKNKEQLDKLWFPEGVK